VTCHPIGAAGAVTTGPAPQADCNPPTDTGDVSEVRRVQRHTLLVLLLTQVVGGIGVAIGIAVGALLAASMAGTAFSGLGQSSLVVGAALLALPVTRVIRGFGRRPGLTLAYFLGAAGAVLVIAAAAIGSRWLLLAGLFLFGGGNAANYQARYAAVDLAEPGRRGRQLSFVVWATTIGAVVGPNLAEAADATVHRFGAATYSGPFAFSAIAFLVAGVAVFAFLRPDPLLTARRLVPARPAVTAAPAAGGRVGIRAAAREVAASPAARLGIASVAVGHLVMVGVMAMTPVHIGAVEHGDTLRIVGIVLSVHIAGMYAFSPVTGWLTDRLGRRPVILGGVALLLVACAVAGTAGHGTVQLSVGLVLLGMGWSATMVAGSTLVPESVGVANRPSVQGLSDLVMGLAAASAGALSGLVVNWSSYGTLTMLAALATVPLLALALRPVTVTRAANVG
jgi:MFS family permease